MCPEKIFGACCTTSFHKNLNLDKDKFENFGGVWRGAGRGLGVKIRTGHPPCLTKQPAVHPCVLPSLILT